jgi:hypothetical protein
VAIRVDQENPWRFAVRVDGVVRGHIVKQGSHWWLHRVDRDDVRGYEGVDVTLVIDEPHYLGMVMRQHMYDA